MGQDGGSPSPTAVDPSPHHPQQPPKSTVYYRPELDALRFLAFLLVFSFHRMDYVPADPIRDKWIFRLGNIGPFGSSSAPFFA